MAVAIFGATSRIAQQLAHQYASQGHAVAVAARDLGEVERIATDVAIRHQVQAQGYAFDAMAFDSHDALVAQIVDDIGGLDVAVLAFGDMGPEGEHEHDPVRAQRVISVNFTGAASLAEALARHLVERGGGSLVGISSVAGDRGRASNYLYGSAKGGFTIYLQGLRHRLFKAGVHVMTVKLGFVDTRMTFGMQTKIPIASPTQAAAAIMQAQQRKVSTLYYPAFWRGIMGVIRAIPEHVFKHLNL